jgi:hypothetical protein
MALPTFASHAASFRLPRNLPPRPRCGLPALLLVMSMLAGAGQAGAAEADAALARYAAARDQMASSAFPDPVHVVSSEEAGRLQADIHSLLAQPFEAVADAFVEPAEWCRVLLLQPNVRQCRVADDGAALRVHFGRRFDQPVADAQAVDFAFEASRTGQRFLRIRLWADRGPIGTRDHLVVLEAVPVDAAQTFMHLRFSQSHGFGARLAARTYLATSGRDKVGFSSAGVRRDGRPDYIGGMRGAVERNAMRYYLAVDAVLASRPLPPPRRFEDSLQRWLDAIERYPLQLAEDDRAAYAAAKRASS